MILTTVFCYQQARTAGTGFAHGQTNQTWREFGSICFAESIQIDYSELYFTPIKRLYGVLLPLYAPDWGFRGGPYRLRSSQSTQQQFHNDQPCPAQNWQQIEIIHTHKHTVLTDHWAWSTYSPQWSGSEVVGRARMASGCKSGSDIWFSPQLKYACSSSAMWAQHLNTRHHSSPCKPYTISK